MLKKSQKESSPPLLFFILLSLLFFPMIESIAQEAGEPVIDMTTDSCFKNPCSTAGESCLEFKDKTTTPPTICPTDSLMHGERCDPSLIESPCCSGYCHINSADGSTGYCAFKEGDNNSKVPNVMCAPCQEQGKMLDDSHPSCCKGLSPDESFICRLIDSPCSPFSDNPCPNPNEECWPDPNSVLVPGKKGPGNICYSDEQCSTNNCLPVGPAEKRCMDVYTCQSCVAMNERIEDGTGCCKGLKEMFGYCVEDLAPPPMDDVFDIRYEVNEQCGIEWEKPQFVYLMNMAQYWMAAMEFTFTNGHHWLESDKRNPGRVSGLWRSDDSGQLNSSFFRFNENFYQIARFHFLMRKPIDTVFAERTDALKANAKRLVDSSDSTIQRYYSQILGDIFAMSADRAMSLSYLYDYLVPMFGPAIYEIADHYWDSFQSGNRRGPSTNTIWTRSDAGDYPYIKETDYNICGNPITHRSDAICIRRCLMNVNGSYNAPPTATHLLNSDAVVTGASGNASGALAGAERTAARLHDPIFPIYDKNIQLPIAWAGKDGDRDDYDYKGHLKSKLQGSEEDPYLRLSNLSSNAKSVFFYGNDATIPLCGNDSTGAIPVVTTVNIQYAYRFDIKTRKLEPVKASNGSITVCGSLDLKKPENANVICLDSGEMKPCITHVQPTLVHDHPTLKELAKMYAPDYESVGIYSWNLGKNRDHYRKYYEGRLTSEELKPHLEATFEQWALLNKVRFNKVPDKSGQYFVDEGVRNAKTIAYEFLLYAFDQKSGGRSSHRYSNQCHYAEKASSMRELLDKLYYMAIGLRNFYRSSAFAFRDSSLCMYYKSEQDYGKSSGGMSGGNGPDGRGGSGPAGTGSGETYTSSGITSQGTSVTKVQGRLGGAGSDSSKGKSSLTAGKAGLLIARSGVSGAKPMPAYTPGKGSSDEAIASLNNDRALNRAFFNRLKSDRKAFEKRNKNTPLLKQVDNSFRDLLKRVKPINKASESTVAKASGMTSNTASASNLLSTLDNLSPGEELSEESKRYLKSSSARSSRGRKSSRLRSRSGSSSARTKSPFKTEKSRGLGRAANNADINRNEDESIFNQIKRAYMKTVDRLFD